VKGYARRRLREVRLSTSKRMWLGSDRDQPSPVDGTNRPRSVKVQERAWSPLSRSGLAMFASPHAFVLHHREPLAVLVSSTLFLAGALPLLWTIG
jgi:hypothetical protein